MSRQFPLLGTLGALMLAALAGCHPQQPVYFPREDGDLSHYIGVATEIEYPDIEAPTPPEVEGSIAPFSLDNPEVREYWDLKLEDAIHIALANSRVMRNIGAQIVSPGAPDYILRNPQLVPTIYDPAIIETNPRAGVEAALSAFDAQFSTLTRWEKVDQPINREAVSGGFNISAIFPSVNKTDTGTFQAQLSKTNIAGGSSTIIHEWIYNDSNSPTRATRSDWQVNLRGEIRQPLLQGAGVLQNRIAGPGAIPGFNNGVMIARINCDIALGEFEAGVRDLVHDVEIAYWELYFTYRNLDAAVVGRDFALQAWRQEEAKRREGTASNYEEGRARQQYYGFRDAVQAALTALYQAEAKLRYVMGLASTDGRLIRPGQEPTTAKVNFDWYEVLAEGLARSVELRQQKWLVKQRELELIAAKNYLLPRLDLVGMWQFQGLGSKLLQSEGGIGNGVNPITGDYQFDHGSNAFQSLLEGNFQNWMLGMEMSMPLGFRKEMAGVRNAQLSLARARVMLQEGELELSHQLAYAIRLLESNRYRAQTAFNRRIAARQEFEAAEQRLLAGTIVLDFVLDSQRRLAEADSAFYRSVVDYNESITELHYRKGSLLEYDGVLLTEGPWPGKAYFDALRRARARDASIYLDYGYTRPKVVSRGPINQSPRAEGMPIEAPLPGEILPGRMVPRVEGQPEVIPTPEPTPMLSPIPEPTGLPEPLPPEPDDARVLPAVIGPALGAAHPAATGPLASRPRKRYDLGALDLSELAAKPSSAPGAASSSAVRSADYEQAEAAPEATHPATATQAAATPPAAAAKPAAGASEQQAEKKPTGWTSAIKKRKTDEPRANPPAAEDHQSASGWKRLQR